MLEISFKIQQSFVIDNSAIPSTCKPSYRWSHSAGTYCQDSGPLSHRMSSSGDHGNSLLKTDTKLACTNKTRLKL